MSSKTSAFAERVYQRLRQVPVGYVTTYGALAQALDSRAYQAIGQVLRINPYAPEVPCHRVVDAQGNLHGFRGKRTAKALEDKKLLLQKEGLKIEDGKIKDFQSHLWNFSSQKNN